MMLHRSVIAECILYDFEMEMRYPVTWLLCQTALDRQILYEVTINLHLNHDQSVRYEESVNI